MTAFLASIAALLAFGAIGWWVLTALAVILLIAIIDNEKPVSAFGLLAVYAVILAISGSFNIFSWIQHHPLDLVKYIAGYIVLGVAWAWLRWEFYTSKKEREYNEFRTEYLEERKLDELVTDGQKQAFTSYASSRGWGPSVIPVRVSHNKARLILWMTYWPFSAPWTLINEPVKHTFEFLYLQLASALQARSNQKFKKYAELN